eukprot:scaffold22124_cov44-Phaeocystis_antarctica.AAC.2
MIHAGLCVENAAHPPSDNRPVPTLPVVCFARASSTPTPHVSSRPRPRPSDGHLHRAAGGGDRPGRRDGPAAGPARRRHGSRLPGSRRGCRPPPPPRTALA